jgi:hypothetical protein
MYARGSQTAPPSAFLLYCTLPTQAAIFQALPCTPALCPLPPLACIRLCTAHPPCSFLPCLLLSLRCLYHNISLAMRH